MIIGDVDFHYASGTMGCAGEGYWWHRFYDFPNLPFTVKTLTLDKNIGLPFAIMRIGRSVFNRVSLHNCGLLTWIDKYYDNICNGATISIHSQYSSEIQLMSNLINNMCLSNKNSKIVAIELNYSCPNVKKTNIKIIPKSTLPIFLKLNYKQDPYDYNLDRVEGIRLNSVPTLFGGGSGKIAKSKNWSFIKRYIKDGINVSGCSFEDYDDLNRLRNMGCTEISIGSTILTNPKLIEYIGRNYVR